MSMVSEIVTSSSTIRLLLILGWMLGDNDFPALLNVYPWLSAMSCLPASHEVIDGTAVGMAVGNDGGNA